jgi:3-hydroxyisobutyrate dehydrogenase-like beta-hydroxyacid dehydrogenase
MNGKPDVGVLGLGIIGSVWARHLKEAGRLAGAWNRTPRPEEPAWHEVAGDVVEASRYVFIVVADPPAVESLLNRISPKLTSEHVVIQSSTIDPESSDRFHRRVAETGARYLEAPFTGSKPAAEARKLVFYLGGDQRLMEEVDPLLALISETRFAIGMPRQAAALKLAMNLKIAIMAEALSESFTYARLAGIDEETYFAVLKKNVAWSGLAALKEPKVRTRDFSPQFSVKHMHKDMRLALASAKGVVNLPLTHAVQQCLARAEGAGAADDDFIALMNHLETIEGQFI